MIILVCCGSNPQVARQAMLVNQLVQMGHDVRIHALPVNEEPTFQECVFFDEFSSIPDKPINYKLLEKELQRCAEEELHIPMLIVDLNHFFTKNWMKVFRKPLSAEKFSTLVWKTDYG